MLLQIKYLAKIGKNHPTRNLTALALRHLTHGIEPGKKYASFAERYLQK